MHFLYMYQFSRDRVIDYVSAHVHMNTHTCMNAHSHTHSYMHPHMDTLTNTYIKHIIITYQELIYMIMTAMKTHILQGKLSISKTW